MDELLDGLRSPSLETWEHAASELRSKADARTAMSDRDFFLVLRPYLWYVHDVSFQDLADACSAALLRLNLHRQELSASEVDADFVGLGLFLASFLEEGNVDARGFRVVMGSAELAAATSATALASYFERAGKESTAAMFVHLAAMLEKLHGAKHTAYGCIREVGDRFLDRLGLIHTLHPEDQRFILHALDGFRGNDAVDRFYADFIRDTADAILREEATEYRDHIRA